MFQVFGPGDVWEGSWLPDQGLNPDPLHWKAVLIANHQGIPNLFTFQPPYGCQLSNHWGWVRYMDVMTEKPTQLAMH